MTGFETYLLIYWVVNAAIALVYIGQGGTYVSAGNLFFGLLWTCLNIFLLFHFGIN